MSDTIYRPRIYVLRLTAKQTANFNWARGLERDLMLSNFKVTAMKTAKLQRAEQWQVWNNSNYLLLEGNVKK